MPTLEYVHVDVFSPVPFGGNSLPVFLDAGGLDATAMLRITQELRHFEAIFLESTARADTVRARVFDLFEELPFAGHPVIGAAAALQHRSGIDDGANWTFELPAKSVSVAVERTQFGYFGFLDQGPPDFLGEVDDRIGVAQGFGLSPEDLDADLPLEIASSGLRYLIVPVRPGVLARARIASDIAPMLRSHGAQFAVLLDEAALELRHWNNDGIIEDIATGSAAGTIGAYRLKHGLTRGGESFILNQGRFTGRPSQLRVRPEGDRHAITTVKVGGDVVLVGRGSLDIRPDAPA
ncbi:MAG: PhzF family phenazine biosynthesis protein [Gemmatimonadaceae bacterium]|nr:PhzF family phenazine biosynthesis protein [Gemmatimonadaceae bacterium]